MSEEQRPQIAGRDVATELMGRYDFAAVVALRLTGSLPTPRQHRLLDALLVMLVEHGLTPSAIATRMTHLAEPDSLAPAVASGLLGAGSRFLGTARLVGEDLAQHWPGARQPADVAERILAAYTASRRHVPGFGHPIHVDGDPRVPVIEHLSSQDGAATPSAEVMHHIEAGLSERAGRRIPLNAAGAMGAALHDVGYPPHLGTAIAIIARSCGLIGHYYEERANPLAPAIWRHARHNLDHAVRTGS